MCLLIIRSCFSFFTLVRKAACVPRWRHRGTHSDHSYGADNGPALLVLNSKSFFSRLQFSSSGGKVSEYSVALRHSSTHTFIEVLGCVRDLRWWLRHGVWSCGFWFGVTMDSARKPRSFLLVMTKFALLKENKGSEQLSCKVTM